MERDGGGLAYSDASRRELRAAEDLPGTEAGYHLRDRHSPVEYCPQGRESRRGKVGEGHHQCAWEAEHQADQALAVPVSAYEVGCTSCGAGTAETWPPAST